jgi:putative RNA 2'-phosphotransferase
MNIKNKSKRLAYLLRYDRKYQFDANGWREVSDLIEKHGFTFEDLCVIVDTNNKQCFEFSEDMQYIRARQGHSIHVDVELEECVPPPILFHGTAEHSVNTILKEGLMLQNRLYVHLSSTIETAINVGKRHGTPVVLKVDAQKMFKDGAKFYLSRNGVWLTDYVATEYLSLE